MSIFSPLSVTLSWTEVHTRAGPKSRLNALTENYVQDFVYRGNGSKPRISEANCSLADTTTIVLCLFFKSEAGARGTGTAHILRGRDQDPGSSVTEGEVTGR